MNSTSRTCGRSFAILMAAVCILASATYAADPTTLDNGVAVTGISGAAASERLYKIDVPAGQDTLQIATSGGTGDVDLYVRRNSPPTTINYDYRPYKVGNNETVDVNNPAAGSWYIMLRGYAGYSGVTLKATYSAAISVKTLANGVAATGLSGAANAELYYSIDVPAGASKLAIAMSGGTGDADLYVKKGSLPTTTSYDYRPYLAGNNETISADNPTAGTWFIMVRGYSSFSGITLLATYGGGSGGGDVLRDGVPVPNLSGAAGSEKLFRFDLPAGQRTVAIKISGGTGDADLYVRLRTAPTATEYDYRPFLAGNNETVTVEAPAAGTWYVMVRGYSDYSGVTLVASWGNVTVLQDGVPVHNLAGALGSETFFRFDVPVGQTDITFEMSGGSGNADLYIKKGAQPTTSSYDFRPVDNGNTESISISTPNPEGTWYVMLKAAKAYDGVTLLADYRATETIVTLSNGVPVTNLSGSAGTEKIFRIDVPAHQQKFEIRISGGTGDADLYVKNSSRPTTSDYDYRPNLLGNNEAVTIDDPIPATWYIMVRGHQAFSGVTLLATYGGAAPETVVTLQNGVAVTGVNGAASAEKFFKIDVPSGQAKLEVAMSGGTGDADLYVRKGSKPTTSEWDYRPYLIGNNESVTINNPTAATYYIMVRGYSAFDGVTLKATYTPVAEQVTTLTNGVPVTGLSGASGSEKFYKINVPAGQDYLTIEISGGSGDVDLYVKKNAKPTITSWDYRPYLIGNNETVQVNNPAAGTWYILLRGYQAYSGLTLKATYGASVPPVTGNNFASDPSCAALWRFESGKLTVDSIGANTLQNHGVTTNTSSYKEGGSSADLNAGETDFLSIDDWNLSSTYPHKNGTTNKQISICFWVKFKSLPGPLGHTWLYRKGENNKESFWIHTYNSLGVTRLNIALGHGADYYTVYHQSPLEANVWYHIGIAYDATNRGYVIHIWDDTAKATLGTDFRDTFPVDLEITDAPVVIGGSCDALIDEMVVFNSFLSVQDMDKIRAGTFGKP